MSDQPHDLLAEIEYFIPALSREVYAMEDTGTKHDQGRALKAVDHLASMVSGLKKRIEDFGAEEA